MDDKVRCQQRTLLHAAAQTTCRYGNKSARFFYNNRWFETATNALKNRTQ
jgi:hypothetical protein